jgi:hypothetical protein
VRIVAESGTLAERILRALPPDFRREHMVSVYGKLAWCLDNARAFV